MNKSQKIYFSTGDTGNNNLDKYVKVKLEQDVETLEFMSIKLGTTDVYQNFNADYGVLVGRVLANGGIGIPNAKISIFISLTDEDAENEEIYSVYPYKTPRDKNNEGKRYNLLPRVSKINPETQQPEPKQAFGSFPIKEEVVTNPPFLATYKKYYKYTALTNDAGDYMIFGVPTGTQTVHLSVDITDIGEYSMNPAAMIQNLGYSSSLFTNYGTTIKPSRDLGDLPNIETQEITVDIIPFWGDTENFEIGINRQDFRVRAILTNTFTIFGSAFTDSDLTMRGTEDNDKPNEREIRDLFFIYPKGSSSEGFSLSAKRIGKIKETIYYYPSEMTDAEIDNADPETDMKVLDPSEYSVYKRNGDFAFIINCNRDKIITDELGEKISVDYDYPDGVFTTFRGFITLEYTEEELPMIATSGLEESDVFNVGTIKEKNRTYPLRLKFKFPQHAGGHASFNYITSDNNNNNAWRKQHMKFEAQKFYSFSKFHGTVANNADRDDDSENGQFPLKEDLFFKADKVNWADRNKEENVGIIYNDTGEMVSNSSDRFGANWLNLSVYFPQTGYALNSLSAIKRVRTSDFLATQWEDNTSRNAYFVFDNSMAIAAGQINTKWYGRSDLHWTDIIEVPLNDIIKMSNTDKGFTNNDVTGLNGLYRNGTYTPPVTDWKGDWDTACPYKGGQIGGIPDNGVDPKTYFFKGVNTADCIQFLYELGLII